MRSPLYTERSLRRLSSYVVPVLSPSISVHLAVVTEVNMLFSKSIREECNSVELFIRDGRVGVSNRGLHKLKSSRMWQL